MQEFRFQDNELSNGRRDFPVRIGLWGMIVVLTSIALFSIYGSRVEIARLSMPLTLLAALIVAGILAAAHMLAYRNAVNTVRRKTHFILTDASLICKRNERPDIQIPLSAISALYSQGEDLIVESKATKGRLVISGKLEGFNTLRNSLAKHHDIITRPAVRFLGVPILLIYGVCCAVVLWCHHPIIVVLASGVGVAVIGLESFYLYGRIKHNPRQRYKLIAFIAFEWLGAALIAYCRLIRS
jgi:hypothetical protein